MLRRVLPSAVRPAKSGALANAARASARLGVTSSRPLASSASASTTPTSATSACVAVRSLSSSARVCAMNIPGENDLVKSFTAGNARTVTLNRPSALNALNLPMVQSLREELDLFLASQTTGVLLLTHEGRAFCSGGDVLAVVRAAIDSNPVTRNQSLEFFQKEYELDYALARLGQFSMRSAVTGSPHDKTAVALLDGITMGGGVGLSSHLPFRVVTGRTMWAMPETGIGFFPDVGVARVLARLDGGVGLYLALTGHRLTGWEAYYLGLGTHYVRSSAIERIKDNLQMTQQDPPTSPTQRQVPSVTNRVNDVLDEFSIDPLDPANEEMVGGTEAAVTQSAFFGAQRVAMDYVFGAHTYPQHSIQSILTALEQLYAPLPWESQAGQLLASGQYGGFPNEAQAWESIAQWAKSTADVLRTKSPRSLVVTHRHIAEAKENNLRLPQSFDVDMRRATAFCDLTGPDKRDFHTGVTHVLEKDPVTKKRRTGTPEWHPASVDQVSPVEVSKLFFSGGNEAKKHLALSVPSLELITPRAAKHAEDHPEQVSHDRKDWRLTPSNDGDFSVPDSLGPLGWAPTHNPFALPSEAECAALLAGEHPGAGETQPSAVELVDALQTFHGNKPGLKRKVLEWASRMTDPS